MQEYTVDVALLSSDGGIVRKWALKKRYSELLLFSQTYAAPK